MVAIQQKEYIGLWYADPFDYMIEPQNISIYKDYMLVADVDNKQLCCLRQQRKRNKFQGQVCCASVTIH
jgi:hypothetical protein